MCRYLTLFCAVICRNNECIHVGRVCCHFANTKSDRIGLGTSVLERHHHGCSIDLLHRLLHWANESTTSLREAHCAVATESFCDFVVVYASVALWKLDESRGNVFSRFMKSKFSCSRLKPVINRNTATDLLGLSTVFKPAI